MYLSEETLASFADEKTSWGSRGAQGPSAQKSPSQEWNSHCFTPMPLLSPSHHLALREYMAPRPAELSLVGGQLMGILQTPMPEYPPPALFRSQTSYVGTHSHPSGVGGEAAAEFIKSKR